VPDTRPIKDERQRERERTVKALYKFGQWIGFVAVAAMVASFIMAVGSGEWRWLFITVLCYYLVKP
jgi:uncharacterized membrane protein YkvA (DUF1232 family)